MSAGRAAISPLQKLPSPNLHQPAVERSPFLGGELSAGSLGCGNDLGEALITAQRIPVRISAASASVGALESGFTVDPWPTMRSAEFLDSTKENVQCSTLNVQRPILRAALLV
jgi:hypothetical protein